MKVLLAGASGAIGSPLTRQLVAHDHQVLGLTRDWDGARRLQALGAPPVVADALDRDGLLRAVDGLAADAVIHELTALRKPPLRHRGMALTNRLRTEGTANLLAAAEALGARRFLTQSVIFGYGYRDHGPRLLTEKDPFGLPAGDACDPHVAAMRSTEQQAFGAPEGIALRYGLLYGGDAERAGDLLARRRLPVAKGGVLGWVHHRGGYRTGCCGWPPRTWPRSWSAPRCASPTPRPRPSSAGGPCTRTTAPASTPWPQRRRRSHADPQDGRALEQGRPEPDHQAHRPLAARVRGG
jgi:hypothetical protein